MMFDIQMTLCEIHPALNILELRKYPVHEVFLLYNRSTDFFNRQKKPKKKNKIMKPAGDDWF